MRKIYILGFSGISGKMLLALILLTFVSACNDDDFVKEEPLDFLTPSNAYTTPEGIESGIIGMYSDLRAKWFTFSNQAYTLHGNGTDVGYDGETPGGQRFLTNYLTSVTPQNAQIEGWWNSVYAEIQSANVLIEAISEIDESLWTNEAEKNAALAEAMFFRAWSYRFAVILWGDVPLVLDVTEGAKVDYNRAPTSEIYGQIEKDLTFAANYLPAPGSESYPGHLTQGAALHLLTEIYLAQDKCQLAIDAATMVIQDFGYSLMTQRFGGQNDVFGSGDVYWDLFRYGNQNPPLNTEAIWNIQFEPNLELGGSSHYWSGIYGPRLVKIVNDPDGNPAFANSGFSDTLGVQVARTRGTNLVFYDIWQGDWNTDIRNAEHNIKRNFYYENPESAYYAKKIDLSKYPPDSRNLLKDTTNYIYPFFMKGWEPLVQATIADATRGGGGAVSTDFYMMRLAETYLLRAEAYLCLSNDQASAAKDINMVRSRANASPVLPADVDIDYILDERIRELYFEEWRLLTLMRTNKLIERTRKYHDNPLLPGANIQDYNNLFPIPQSQIDLNIESDFKQNPGYD